MGIKHSSTNVAPTSTRGGTGEGHVEKNFESSPTTSTTNSNTTPLLLYSPRRQQQQQQHSPSNNNTSSATEQRIARMNSSALETKLAASAKKESEVIQLLILGGPSAGKTTVLKQLRELYMDPDDDNNYSTTNNNIHTAQDIFHGILEATRHFAVSKNETGLVSTLEELLLLDENNNNNNKIKQWTSVDFLTFYTSSLLPFIERNKPDLPDDFGLEYLIQNTLPRILAEGNDYVPNSLDKLRACTSPRVGISVETFKIDGVQFQISDVSSQGGNVRKYLHMFDRVTAVIFVHNMASMETFDETLDIFNETVNCSQLKCTPVLLFLNKLDVLTKFFMSNNTFHHDTNKFHSQDLEATKDYILRCFISTFQEYSNRDLYHHFTTMTDTAKVQVTFNVCKDTILKNNLRSSGFMD
jgi:GTPase SAR1 family protein